MRFLIYIVFMSLLFLTGCSEKSSENSSQTQITIFKDDTNKIGSDPTPENTPETYIVYPHDNLDRSSTPTDGRWDCFLCHKDKPGWIPDDNVTVPQNIDDTLYNNLCLDCHDGESAPYAKTHSSLSIDNDYGDWNIECRTCHNPHRQLQLETYGIDSYTYSGQSEAINDVNFTDSDANWSVDELKDYILFPDANNTSINYRIRNNTQTIITLHTAVDLNKTTVGDNYAIIYGKLIKNEIKTPNSGLKEVKFFRKIGTNAYADGDTTLDGICEVCHTQTRHHRNNDDNPSEASRNHNITVSCTVCHQHKYGFKPIPPGAHETHLQAEYGPQISCSSGAFGCHGANIPGSQPTILFADNFDLNNTQVCTQCHSTTGVPKAKQYFPNPGSSTGDVGSWRDVEGEASYCGSCHDNTPDSNVSGFIAPNVMGDNSTYGFFVTGHGKSEGNYTRLSWQDTTANGNPAANKVCSECHDYTSKHIDSNDTKRLKIGYQNDANSAVCMQCHTTGGVADADPKWFTNYTDYNNSAHGASKGFNFKCTQCHDVHGMAGTAPAMTIANQETLCYQCHSSTGSVMQVINEDISNNKADGHVSSNYINDSFAKWSKHNLGSSYTISGKTYTLECVNCHNVHMVTGKYWDAKENKSPITRISTPSNPQGNLNIWGDEPSEKMDAYAKNSAGSGGWYYSMARGDPASVAANQAAGGRVTTSKGGTYQPPKARDPSEPENNYENLEFSGKDLPAYTTFCLDCHASDMGGGTQGAVDWGGDYHGLSLAGTPSNSNDQNPLAASFWSAGGNPDPIFAMNYVSRSRGVGHFSRWPYDMADRSAMINFVLSCTDCHEAHGSGQSSNIRERIQNAGHGDGGNWNNFCNACHYFYGGHHAGMSCGSASCHQQNSLHRIDNRGSPGGPRLDLTNSNDASTLYAKPDFTPDIEWVNGTDGSTRLVVKYNMTVFGNQDLNESITQPSFWMFRSDGVEITDPFASVELHSDSRVILTLKNALIQANINNYTIATKPKSIWGYYAGGYQNTDNSIPPLESGGVPAGPWPVVITETPPLISNFSYGRSELKLNGIVDDSNQVVVIFADGVYTNNNATGDLQITDFTLNCNARSISSIVHTAGDNFATLTLSSIVNQAEIGGACTIEAKSGAIYDAYGAPAITDAVTLSLPPIAESSSLVLNWNFNESSNTETNNTNALGTQEILHGNLIRNVDKIPATKPGATAGDRAILFDGNLTTDFGSVQLNYTTNPNDGYPPATYDSGGVSLPVAQMQNTDEFSFSLWMKPTAIDCEEGGSVYGLSSTLARFVMTTKLWVKNWGILIRRTSVDDNITGTCTTEDSTYDVLRFMVSVGDSNDQRCDQWGGQMPGAIRPVNPTGYYEGNYMPGSCGNASYTMPTIGWTRSFAQTETNASGAPTYGVSLQSGVWQFVSGTWDGRYIRIYIDGKLAAQTDMGGSGSYTMLNDPHIWGGAAVNRHVSSGFSLGSVTKWGGNGATYWNANQYYDINNQIYIGEIDDAKYWKKALPLSTIQW